MEKIDKDNRRNKKSKTVSLASKPLSNSHPVSKKSTNEITHLKGSKSIKRTHYLALESNLDFNDQMEDVGLAIPNFCHSSKKSLYAIFDGHNGVECAKNASVQFPIIFEKILTDNALQIENYLTNAFKLLDEKSVNFEILGCTATVVYIDNNDLYCANVGDSSCMLVYKTKAEKISYDDKCTDPKEKERIKKEGGYIDDERLSGIIAISRAIGDFMLKKNGLTCIPHINKKTINGDVKFCVIASDGVWDVIDERQLFELNKNVKEAKEFAEKIVKKAMDLGSEDNISCLVIKFD